MEGGDGGETSGENKMASPAGLTNGHVTGEVTTTTPGGEVVVRSKPQVTESTRSSEKIGENSADVERFKSKVTEFSDVGKNSVAQEKQYEENALKAMREKSDGSEMTSTTETRLTNRDRIETSDTGETKSHHSENQDKQHETTSSTTEKVGDMTASMAKTDSSHQKSAVSIDASSDGSHAVLVDLDNDSFSKSVEEISGENFKGTRSVETSKSERKMEYTSHGPGNGGGSGFGKGELDLGSQFDELFGSSKVNEVMKKEQGEQRGISFMEDYNGGNERLIGARDMQGMGPMEGDFRKRVGGARCMPMETADFDDFQGTSGGGFVSRRQKRQMEESSEAYSSRSEKSWGLSTDRKTADDLVQRILSESRGGPSVPSPRPSRVFNEDPPFSPTARDHPFSPYSPGARQRFSQEEDGPLSPSAMKRDMMYKVDMGDSSSSGSRAMVSMEKESMERQRTANGYHGLDGQEFQLPPLKRRPQKRQEEMSLLDRRLASMGFDTKLGQQMYIKKDSGNNEGYLETTYISKKKPPGTFLGQADEDMDDEIEAMRSTFRESLNRRSQILQDDYDDDDSMSSGGTRGGYRSRGRMERQRYVDDETDAYGYRGSQPPVPDEDFIPDEEFMPQKRPETEEVVKEKTSSIRTVVDQQATVLEKLKEASSSFDDLSNEIRSIKQQFMENQMKRSYITGPELDNPNDDDLDPISPRGHGFDRGGYGYVAPIDADGYRPYIPRKQRMEMQRSRSLYEDTYRSPGGMDLEDPEEMYPMRTTTPLGRCSDQSPMYPPRDQMSTPLGHYDQMDDDDDDELGYGAQPAHRPAAYASDANSSYQSSSTASRYLSRPSFNRAHTLSDFNFDRPTSPAGYSRPDRGGYERPLSPPTYIRNDRYDRPSTFSSRFLDKVREKKAVGGFSATEHDSATPRTFKSRFLRDSLMNSMSSSSATPSSYSKSSSYSSRSAMSSSAKVAVDMSSDSVNPSTEEPITANSAPSPAPSGGASDSATGDTSQCTE